MAISPSDIVHQGWLWKSPPPTKILFRPKQWTRRWFLIKCGSFPNQYVLEYYDEENGRHPKRTINLDECDQICGPLHVHGTNHRHALHLRTPKRTYYMAASTQAEISKWIETLRFVCGIKMIENDHHKTAKSKCETTAKPVSSVKQKSSGKQSVADSSGEYIQLRDCLTLPPPRPPKNLPFVDRTLKPRLKSVTSTQEQLAFSGIVNSATFQDSDVNSGPPVDRKCKPYNAQLSPRYDSSSYGNTLSPNFNSVAVDYDLLGLNQPDPNEESISAAENSDQKLELTYTELDFEIDKDAEVRSPTLSPSKEYTDIDVLSTLALKQVRKERLEQLQKGTTKQ